MKDERPRCPGCGGLIVDGDWADHETCITEAQRAKYDETDRDDYQERDRA